MHARGQKQTLKTLVQGLLVWAVLAALAWGLRPDAPVRADTVVVACDTGALIDAIDAANANGQPDVLQLQAGCTYRLTAQHNGIDGGNGLPPITGEITIAGNGAIIDRDTDSAVFRILHVAAT